MEAKKLKILIDCKSHYKKRRDYFVAFKMNQRTAITIEGYKYDDEYRILVRRKYGIIKTTYVLDKETSTCILTKDFYDILSKHIITQRYHCTYNESTNKLPRRREGEKYDENMNFYLGNEYTDITNGRIFRAISCKPKNSEEEPKRLTFIYEGVKYYFLVSPSYSEETWNTITCRPTAEFDNRKWYVLTCNVIKYLFHFTGK